MRRLLPALVLLLCVGMAHAQNTEIDQLKAEIKALREIVMQLTTRLQAIEGELMTQQGASAAAKPIREIIQPNSSGFTPAQKTTVEYTIEKLLPKLRIDSNHAFEIHGVESKPKPGSSNEEYLYFKVLCTNRANEDWDTRQDSYRLLLDTGDLVGNRDYAFVYGPNSVIKKNERTERTIGFTIKNPQPELEGVLKITSQKYNTSVDFRVKLIRKETKEKIGS